MERLGSCDEQIRERYVRHINLKEIGENGQHKLKNSSVLIVGAGGLGSPISLYLTAAGIGRIGLIDPDIVSLSNLQRQVLYRESDIGKSKVEIAKERLLELNSDTVIETYAERLNPSNATDIISKYDIVVDGCDNFETRYCIDEYSSKLNKPYVYGSIGEFKGQVSVFNYREGRRYSDLFPGDDNSRSSSANNVLPGVMGVVPGVIGTMQAAEVIKIITGAGDLLINKLLMIDLLTMNQMVLEI